MHRALFYKKKKKSIRMFEKKTGKLKIETKYH